MVTVLAWLNGLTSLTIVTINLVIFVVFLLRYLKTKKSLMPYVSALGFCTSSFYWGPSVSFFALLFTESNIDKNLAGLLTYTLLPVATMLVMYIGFEIFNPERKRKAIGFVALTAIPFWIALFGFTDAMVGTNPVAEGELIEYYITSVVLVLASVYIVMILAFLCPGFYHLHKRVEGEAQQRSLALCRGFIIFCGASVIEVAFPQIALAARIANIVAFSLLWYGIYAAASE